MIDRNPVPVRYRAPGDLGGSETVEDTLAPALGIPIKVTRPTRRGTFETVRTDTLSNARYMQEYEKWFEEKGHIMQQKNKGAWTK